MIRELSPHQPQPLRLFRTATHTSIITAATTTIMVMTLFSQPYIVTKGGPSNQTLTPLLHIYRIGVGSQGAARIGDASALTFILSLIMITVVVMQFLITRRRESN